MDKMYVSNHDTKLKARRPENLDNIIFFQILSTTRSSLWAGRKYAKQIGICVRAICGATTGSRHLATIL
jgi:hypothetical protein